MEEQNTYTPVKIAIAVLQIGLMSLGTYFMIKKVIDYIKKPKELPMHDDEKEEEYELEEPPDFDEMED